MKPESQKFLTDIKSDSEASQLAAWTGAGKMDAEVIPPLSELLVSDDMRIAKAADEALKKITHSVGRKLRGKRWKSVVDAYVEVLDAKYPTWSRGIALRHLSLIADDKPISAISQCLREKDIREEAVYCLQRIPEKKATSALADALGAAPDDFKPRILLALGYREDSAARDAVMAEYRSRNTKVRLAALEALARIGVDRDGWEWPSMSEFVSSMTATQEREFVNNLLLLSDTMVEKGQGGDWLSWYYSCMDESPDEHVRCAGIVGLANYAKKQRRGKAKEVVSKRIESKTRDEAYIVRITAEKALESLKG